MEIKPWSQSRSWSRTEKMAESQNRSQSRTDFASTLQPCSSLPIFCLQQGTIF